VLVSCVDREFLSECRNEPVEWMSNKQKLVVIVEAISRRGRTQRAETRQVPAGHVTVVYPVEITWVSCGRQFARRYGQYLNNVNTIEQLQLLSLDE